MLRDGTMPSWKAARHILMADDQEESDVTTEIFVLDLPFAYLEQVVNTIGKLPDLEVTSFREETVEGSRNFDELWQTQLTSASPTNIQLAELVSASGTSDHLQVYIWLSERGQIEVELCFWVDLTFPPDLDETELTRRFDRLITIANACRAGATESMCVLGSETIRDPRNLSEAEKTWSLVW